MRTTNIKMKGFIQQCRRNWKENIYKMSSYKIPEKRSKNVGFRVLTYSVGS
jgi:hypothetical protein